MSAKRSKTFFLFVLLPIFLTSTHSQQNSFFYKGFNSPVTNLSLNGIAEIETSGILKLTNESRGLLGRAFYPKAIPFKTSNNSAPLSFSTSFVFAIVPQYPNLGGHGFAFVISPNKELAGAQPRQYLGIFNPNDLDLGNVTDHKFAIEFDTVQDLGYHDINDNHIGVDINNIKSDKSAPAAYIDDNGQKQDLNLRSGDRLQAWVDYDGINKIINITISPFSKKPNIPLISYPVDLSPIFQNQMYVGFSASTGLVASSHCIMGWSFALNKPAMALEMSSLPSLPKPKKTHTIFRVIMSSAAFFIFLLAITAAGYIYYKIKNTDIIEPWEFEYGPYRFSYTELKHATKNFRDKELLGSGGFGKVYKGLLPKTKTEVAVKRIAHGSKQGLREFVAEITSIGRLRHRNLVCLQGWCRRRSDLLLVYDYMENGSLDKFLFQDGPSASTTQSPSPNRKHPVFILPWAQRFKIIKDVALALLYLHEEWEHVVIHRDVKASNVLLDSELKGRLGDFGLAKLYEHGANPNTTRVVGTLGYLAPELTRTGKATTSSDVFAFGALVLEIVCGRRPIDPKAKPDELVLVDWVWEKYSLGKWMEALDPKMDKCELVEAEVAVRVGLICSHPISGVRPSMREVVRYLDGGDVLEVPVVKMPPSEYEGVVNSGVGFEDFVHSYPSSSFEKLEEEGEVSGGDRSLIEGYSPMSLLSGSNV